MKTWRRFFTARAHNAALLSVLLAAAAGLAAVLSLCLGAVALTPDAVLRALLGQGDAIESNIVLYVRLPRTCGGLLAGGALAVSGAIIQGVLANPLAAPHIIGVNAGAGLLVVLCCAVLPLSTAALPVAAFCGAFLGVMLVLLIAERAGAARITLVLAGVAMSSIFSAGIDALITLFPDALNGYSDFRIGGFANLTMARLTPAFWVIAGCLALVLLLGNELDVLMLGAETAHSLGLPVRRVRVGMLALAAALAGAAVSFSGLLGFVGLIVPHMMRRLVGEESRRLIPACALGGATLLTLCDVAARTLFAPFELPVGIVLSLAGGPFFIWLLLRQRGGRLHD